VKQGAQDYLVKGQADGQLLARSCGTPSSRMRIRLALDEQAPLARCWKTFPTAFISKKTHRAVFGGHPAVAKLFRR